MEKLQKALEEARQARERAFGQTSTVRSRQETVGSGETAAPSRQARGDQTKQPDQFPPLWSELTPYEPNPDHLKGQRIITLNAEPGSNPFDVLRTKVFMLMRQKGWKRLAITSPNKSCGKTTTACNLAVGMSRQRENRTMLFDLDMRRPNIANVLGRKPHHGIKAMLTGEVSPEDQMLCLRGNVALSMNTAAVPDSTQLLMAQRTADKFDRIQSDFDPDMMIFDLPPMFAADDTRAFLRNVDCAMIVARSEYTKTSQLDLCEREVAAQTNVLGVVLNNCRHTAGDEEYYGDYE